MGEIHPWSAGCLSSLLNASMKIKLLLLSLLLPSILHAGPRVTAAAVAAHKYTVITALPYNIIRPGTYILLGNLTDTLIGTPAVTINAPGPVVFNLNGYTISGGSTSNSPNGVLIQSSNVTVENGTITEFFFGRQAGTMSTSDEGGPMIDNIVIRDIVFDFDFQFELQLSNINGGSVSDCTFSGGRFGAVSESGCVGIQHRNLIINGEFFDLFSISGRNGAGSIKIDKVTSPISN
jgi:hypothetical protein